MPMKAEVNQVLTGEWKVEMMQTPTEKPLLCCYGFWCPCCFAHQQREKLLDITGEPYVCCAGMIPCCCFGEPCGGRQPWLCLESCCCTSSAILGNRFMLQTRFNIRNDPCDNTLLSIIACLNCLSLILRIFADRGTADACENITECVNASVCACMLTQQEIQIKEIEESSRKYTGMSQQILLCLPPQQQQMINGFQHLTPTAPIQGAPPQYGAMQPGGAGPPLQGVPGPATRQMMVAVPEGTMPGQMVQFQTPEGNTVQVPVPAGVAPGQQFTACY